MLRRLLPLLFSLFFLSTAIACVDLDGDDYTTIAYNAALVLPDGDWSRAFWAKGANTGTGYDDLVCWGDHNANPSFRLQVFHESHASDPGMVSVYIEDADQDSVNSYSAGDVWNESAWNLIVVIRASDTLYLYVNNVLADSDSMADVDAVDVTDTAMALGARGDGAYAFPGSLAEVGFWTADALDETERTALMTSPPSDVATVTWYFPLYVDDDADAGGLEMTLVGNAAIDSGDHPDLYDTWAWYYRPNKNGGRQSKSGGKQ